MVDKKYCMNSYLIFRHVVNRDRMFFPDMPRNIYLPPKKRIPVADKDELSMALRYMMQTKIDKQTGIMLSGGMDSAILARMMPHGAYAYTLECDAEGVEKETEEARRYAESAGLRHKVIHITWDDYILYTPILMKHKGAPIHSIEVMIYKAMMEAKKDGCTKMVFGENADIIYGGMDGLLSRDWTFEEFIKRYTYVDPFKVLREPMCIPGPFIPYRTEYGFDAHGFINDQFYREAINSYSNACAAARIEYIAPYSYTYMNIPVDLKRIRQGESKYIVRELFAEMYRDEIPAKKLPMPRGVGIWLKNWGGPERPEFLPECSAGLKGDQKWMVYCLELFLKLYNPCNVQ